jgi:hypothetical protein
MELDRNSHHVLGNINDEIVRKYVRNQLSEMDKQELRGKQLRIV